jgi:hypothetical protein
MAKPIRSVKRKSAQQEVPLLKLISFTVNFELLEGATIAIAEFPE